MLNQLFKGSAGFKWGVRATAFLALLLLFISNFIMFPNPPPDDKPVKKADAKAAIRVLKDPVYMLCVFWSVLLSFTSASERLTGHKHYFDLSRIIFSV